MARSFILGNGGLTVGLDEKGLVHDFYYPYVGQENLTTARSQPHMVGVWVDGAFSWIGGDGWQSSLRLEKAANISRIVHTNDALGIHVSLTDFVDCSHDVFGRKVTVKNLLDSERNVRLFFHQVFRISHGGRADTVMYVPDDHYLLDYKGRCTLGIYAETADGKPFDQYACGGAGVEGKEGTFRDAEDGELSMSAVEHGGVDSTLRVKFTLAARSEEVVHYTLAAADSQHKVNKLLNLYRSTGFEERLEATREYWSTWLEQASVRMTAVPEDYRDAVTSSLMIIKAHTDKHGGIIASCDSSIYNYGRDYYSYVWPRDGAWVMWPFIKLGFTDEPKKFFRFCQSILHEDGYLLHKYQPDRSIGSTWHPLVHGRTKELAIQEDETAIVLWLLGEYVDYSKDTQFASEMYSSFVKPAADFMTDFIDDETSLPHPSYDLWEEKFLSTLYTTSSVYAALLTASRMAHERGEQIDADRWTVAAERIQSKADAYFVNDVAIKGFSFAHGSVENDNVLDVSSLYGAWRWGYVDQGNLKKTLARVESDLLNQSPSGGSPRYVDDAYFRSDPAYKGNPWFVTTLWLSQLYSESGRLGDAKKLVDWSVDKALESGVLSEQIHPETGQPVGVTPLIWSHAELINAILILDQRP